MFKKIAIAVFALLITLFFAIKNEKPIFSDYSSAYDIYLQSASSNAVIVSATNTTYPLIFGKVGESCKIKGEFNLSCFLNKMSAKTLFIEKTEDGTSYYAYSSDIRYNKVVNGKRVNLHVHIGKSGITVGSPIIFGSF